MAEGSKVTPQVESILDLNSNNVWNLDEFDIQKLWATEKEEEDFSTCEDKLLNTIRTAFEVVHYNPADPKEAAKYENGEWGLLEHCNKKKGFVAIRRRVIKRITDLNYDNIKHITAAQLLDLIDRNFGGGWESIALSMRDIIESGFDVSSTQLPASRIHLPGGTVERKVNQGYDMLEIAKGTWVEAIFAKKKDPMVKLRFESMGHRYDEEGNSIDATDDDDDEDLPETDDEDVDEDEDDSTEQDEETFYSSYSPEAEVKNEDDEGFPLEEE